MSTRRPELLLANNAERRRPLYTELLDLPTVQGRESTTSWLNGPAQFFETLGSGGW